MVGTSVDADNGGSRLRPKGNGMGKVIASASMSLDGFIAKDDNTIGRLFDWYQNGEVEFPTATEDITFHLSPESAEHWRRWVSALGALVCGRTLFDVTDGWGGRHTMDVPVVVVTHQVPTSWVEAHPNAPFQFVTDGVEAAVARAQEIAGDRLVAVGRRYCRPAMSGARPPRRGRGRHGACGHGKRSPILRGAVARGCPARRPTGMHPGNRVTHLVFPTSTRSN